MLAFSHTTGYAIRALSCLAATDRAWMLVRDIAACTDIPAPYLSKLLHKLTGLGLVRGKRGYRGGFALGKPAEAISLLEVAEAVEGEEWLPRCLLGMGDEHNHCPTHAFWAEQRIKIRAELARLTIQDVAAFELRQCNKDACCSSVTQVMIPAAAETPGRADEPWGAMLDHRRPARAWPEAGR